MSVRQVPMPADHHPYMSGENGPFECRRCEYYPAADRCANVHIIALARDGRFGLKLMPDGRAKVDPLGCSDYFEPK